jgi:hypothetical protein
MEAYPKVYNIFSNYEIATCAIFRVFSSKGTFKCDKIKPIRVPAADKAFMPDHPKGSSVI